MITYDLSDVVLPNGPYKLACVASPKHLLEYFGRYSAFADGQVEATSPVRWSIAYMIFLLPSTLVFKRRRMC